VVISKTKGGPPATRQVSFPFFSGVVEFVFCRGFREKRGAERGFLDGEIVVECWRKMVRKRPQIGYEKYATFLDLFLGFPVLGKCG